MISDIYNGIITVFFLLYIMLNKRIQYMYNNIGIFKIVSHTH